MKKIYFTRHGQTVWNVENKICGATGIPMRVERRLKEQNFGRYESTPRDGAEFKAATAQLSLSIYGSPL